MSQHTSTFEADLPISVVFHTQSISSCIKVQETLYFANPFRIKLKVTLNIGVTKVYFPKNDIPLHQYLDIFRCKNLASIIDFDNARSTVTN